MSNSQLTPELEQMYQAWRTKEETRRGHSLESDDYDMRGFWLEGGGGLNNERDPFVMPGVDGSSHFNDAHKLPNHPTFSDEALRSSQKGGAGPAGGHWNEDSYVPSPQMLADGNPAHGMDTLKKYFSEVEPGIRLVKPPLDEFAVEQLRKKARK